MATMNSRWHSIVFISKMKNFQNVHFINDFFIQTGNFKLIGIPRASEKLYHQMCETFPPYQPFFLQILKKKEKKFSWLYICRS